MSVPQGIIFFVLTLIFNIHLFAAEEKMPPKIAEFFATEIPKVEFKESSLIDALDFMRIKIRDTRPDGPGISAILNLGDGKDVNPRGFTYSREEVTLDQFFSDLANHFNIQIHVTPHGLVIYKLEHRPEPGLTIYKTYRPEK